ncbi:subclass B1 metallo-beta-lactamase [Thalassotalea sp. M1531]|uniref:beta-lactamase n=1 Tax=Thalassotalea algicola TaxID=2716224 RepID=A0A7Y0Q8Z9_9GAMM|nr:subclass B1 metallo-beta-lactamase [Thalassotalea algicola]NMP33467.1 subclass B1 metallo-beta-lactamase [Thalassotalea algicola]
MNTNKLLQRTLAFSLLGLFSAITFAKSPQLTIKKLADNVYQHISYENIEPWGMVAASGLVVIDGSEAHIIDTPWSSDDTEKLTQWAYSKGLVVKSAVATHFHRDASGGIPFLNKSNITTYATSRTNHLLHSAHKEKASDEITHHTYELVKNKIEVFYPGAGHSQDNIVIWLPQSKILFGGCFVKSLKSKNLGNTEDASIADWPSSIKNVINQFPDIEIVVPGHGKMGDASLLSHTANLAIKSLKSENR